MSVAEGKKSRGGTWCSWLYTNQLLYSIISQVFDYPRLPFMVNAVIRVLACTLARSGNSFSRLCHPVSCPNIHNRCTTTLLAKRDARLLAWGRDSPSRRPNRSTDGIRVHRVYPLHCLHSNLTWAAFNFARAPAHEISFYACLMGHSGPIPASPLATASVLLHRNSPLTIAPITQNRILYSCSHWRYCEP